MVKAQSGKYQVILFLSTILPALCGILPQWGCGAGAKTEQEKRDTVDIKQFIARGPDSNIYPVLCRTTSQRYPLEKYGPEMMTDGDPATYWCSTPGLHYGEEVRFTFDQLDAFAISVTYGDDPLLARMNGIEVWVDDSLVGIAQSGQKLPLRLSPGTLVLRATRTEGYNEVDMPVLPDSTAVERTVYERYSIAYNSKSFGIREIEFFDASGRKLPVKWTPYREAEIKVRGFKEMDGLHLSDGNEMTSITPKPDDDPTLQFLFSTYTPLLKFSYTPSLDAVTGVPIPMDFNKLFGGTDDGDYQVQWGNPGNPVSDADTKVARTFIFRFPRNVAAAPAELRFWDGARWYAIRSVYERAEHEDRLDTLQRTVLKGLVNNRIFNTSKRILLTTDTVKILNPASVPSDLIRREMTIDAEMVFRSNFTFEYISHTRSMYYGDTPGMTSTDVSFSGVYRIISVSSGSISLELSGTWNRMENTEGKSRKQKYWKVITCTTDGKNITFSSDIPVFRGSY